MRQEAAQSALGLQVVSAQASTSLSVRIQHAHFSIALEILQNQNGSQDEKGTQLGTRNGAQTGLQGGGTSSGPGAGELERPEGSPGLQGEVPRCHGASGLLGVTAVASCGHRAQGCERAGSVAALT